MEYVRVRYTRGDRERCLFSLFIGEDKQLHCRIDHIMLERRGDTDGIIKCQTRMIEVGLEGIFIIMKSFCTASSFVVHVNDSSSRVVKCG